MSFHVGQKVVCVDDSPPRSGLTFKAHPVKGRVYTIAAIGSMDGEPAVDLVELGKLGACLQYPDWLASRFRPVKETDISIFTSMLVPTPKQKVSA